MGNFQILNLCYFCLVANTIPFLLQIAQTATILFHRWRFLSRRSTESTRRRHFCREMFPLSDQLSLLPWICSTLWLFTQRWGECLTVKGWFPMHQLLCHLNMGTVDCKIVIIHYICCLAIFGRASAVPAVKLGLNPGRSRVHRCRVETNMACMCYINAKFKLGIF